MTQKNPMMEKVNKWGAIFFFVAGGLGMGAIGARQHFAKPVLLSDLEHVSGVISNQQIVDEDKNHEITLKIEGQRNSFVFKGVDWFPIIKPVLPSAKAVEIWVDKNNYNGGDDAKIFQMILDGKMVVKIDDWNRESVKRGNFLIRIGAAFTLVGAVLIAIINMKDSVLSNKLFRIASTIILLIASIVQVYLGFIK